MKKMFLIGCLGTFIFAGLAVLITGLTIWSHRNEALTLQYEVKAQYESNQSNYDKMWKSFKEMAQVSDMQANDIQKVYGDIISGRYDKDNSVLFKMVQEQNPQMNTQLYSELQRNIQSSRNEFDDNQKAVVDKIREYNTYIGKAVVMNFFFKFPELNTNDYIVTSEKTDKAFKTGKDDEINIKGE